MSFPGSIPSYTGFTSGETLKVAGHASQHNAEQADIVALATKVGIGSATPASNTVLRGTGTGTSTFDQVHGDTDIKNSLPASILSNVYPVGAIYTEITGVNPATTFGFGTWSQFGEGQVLVGQKPGDANFGTVLSTGGETAHILSAAEMPTHTHAVTDPGHYHVYKFGSAAGGDGSALAYASTGGTEGTQTAILSNTTGVTNQNAGNSGAHNNLQPYIIVFFWQRTA